MIGIIVGIFTAVVITQLYVNMMSESKLLAKKSLFGIKKNNRATFHINKDLHFMKYKKVFYAISIIIIAAGLGFSLVRGMNYGIDFTGGTMIQMDMGKTVPISEVEDAISEYNLDPEIIYSGENNEQIVIRTIESLGNDERADVINSINETFGTTNENVVSQELFGPSVGKDLRNNAILAIVIAGLCMLVYIRLRFSQWKFGGAALLGVLHDVLIMLAFYAIFGITINNPFIAGILTVIGYSINDTIVVFDRIRENKKYHDDGDLAKLIDRSITQTLGRSLMTSFTTLVVMIPLLILGGESIREFVLPLMVGIIAGAYSSIAVCSPLYYDFNGRRKLSKYEKQVKANIKNNKKKAKKIAAPDDDKEKEELKAKALENIQEDDDNPGEQKTSESLIKEENSLEEKEKGKTEANKKRSKRYVKGNKNKG